jgi:hypothetical protein
MTNHYHLLVETPDGNLSKGMRQLNGVFTQTFNKRHERVGHVFQGRYKAILVQKESYLLELARYIVLNPMKAGVVNSIDDWEWSSFPATAGMAEKENWLTVDWILSVFSSDRTEAFSLYRAFVLEGMNRPDPFKQLKQQIYLGSDEFLDKMLSKVAPGVNLSEIPFPQKHRVAKPISYFANKYPDRDTAISKAYASGIYTLKEIGDYFTLHYSRVSRIVKAKDKT